jgi:hypothetical protein
VLSKISSVGLPRFNRILLLIEGAHWTPSFLKLICVGFMVFQEIGYNASILVYNMNSFHNIEVDIESV